jgi:hypothetical protein
MQELAARFREAGLHVFRHRRGMLFVSPIYPRAFQHEETGVSPQVRTILEAIGAAPRIGRKELADKLIDASSPFRPAPLPGSASAGDVVDLEKSVEAAVSAVNDSERAKLILASDLRWLISAGHVIEFNDGSLDLPRAKAKRKEQIPVAAGVSPASQNAEMAAAEKEARVEAGAPPADEPSSAAKEPEAAVETGVSPAEEPSEIGGS